MRGDRVELRGFGAFSVKRRDARLGRNPRTGDHVEVVERDPDGRVAAHFVVASFVGRWVSGEAETGPEALSTVWVPPDSIGSLATTAELGPILLRAAKIAAT